MKTLLLILAVLCFALIENVQATDCVVGWKRTDKGCESPYDYGRGAGYPWKFGDGLNLKGAKKRCLKDNPELGCQKVGDIYYPSCRPGFKNDLCCFCHFDNFDFLNNDPIDLNRPPYYIK